MASTDAIEAHRLKCEMAGDVLRSTGAFRLKVNGWSMLPTIWPGDILEIGASATGEAAPGDIVLYGRDERLFVHRVVAFRGGQLITRGDAMPEADPPVPDGGVMGRVQFIVRRGGKNAPSRRLTIGQRAIARLVRSGSLGARTVVRLENLRQNLGTMPS